MDRQEAWENLMVAQPLDGCHDYIGVYIDQDNKFYQLNIGSLFCQLYLY